MVASVAMGCAIALGASLVSSADESEQEAVSQAFRDYQAAVLGRDGEKAVGLIAQSSIDYIDTMQQLALYGSPDEVRAQPLANQLQVLSFRHRIGGERLRDMTARELFAFTTKQGWNDAGVAGLEPGKIRIEGDVAAMEIRKGGRPTGVLYRYVREDGPWRWDMPAAVELSNRAFAMLAQRRGVAGEVVVVSLLEAASGNTVDASVWEPPFPPPSREGTE